MDTKSEHSPPDSLFEQNVRILAHYLYVCRGCKEGRSLDNWLEAEKLLREALLKPDEID